MHLIPQVVQALRQTRSALWNELLSAVRWSAVRVDGHEVCGRQ
jgi:hypothetical protein